MLKLEPKKDDILEWYDNGKSYYWIAKELGEYEQAVSNLVKKYRDVPVWKPYEIDEDYFKVIDSPDKAYHFGLIAADGAIVKANSSSWTMTISLQEQDSHILHKMRRDFQAEAPVREYTQEYRGRHTNFYTQSRLVVANQRFCEHLFNHKITPRKSKTLEGLIDEVHPDVVPDLIRGYFDGDGSVHQTVTSGTQVKNYVSFRGTKIVLEEIQDYLQIGGSKIYYGYGSTSNSGAYAWRFGAVKDIKKFKNIIYHDQMGDLYFPRKKEKFLW